MAHEILSVKLCELDEKIRRIHSRVQMSESALHGQIAGEITELRKECEETEEMLWEELKFSQSDTVSGISEAYGEVQQIIQKMKDKMNEPVQDNEDEASLVERKILFAEYALDFAMQAANQALLISMEAIDAQMTLQEKAERSLL